MQTLFGEIKDKQDSALIIKANGQRVLTKNQQIFNKLTKRIETLENEIVQENESLSKLLELHNTEIYPFQIKVANIKVQLAITLDIESRRYTFTKNQIGRMQITILALCDAAFRDIEPTSDQEAFYDKWSDVSYKEGIEQQSQEEKEILSDFMNGNFGMNIDVDDFEDTPEGFALMQKKIKELIEEQQQQEREENKTNKKQKARDENKKAGEEIKNKNIRSIYIALAKVLHPDAESDLDATLKDEREEIMKKVTVAYDQKDLSTLLKLELEWVHKTSEHLEKLSDDKLKIYISALKNQAVNLQNEKNSLHFHPRYAPISDYAYMFEKYAIDLIKFRKREFKSELTNLEMFISVFRNSYSKKYIVEFLKDFRSYAK